MLGEFFIIKKRVLSLMKGLFKTSDLVLDAGCGKNPYYHKAISSKIICADILQTKKVHLVADSMSLPLKKSKFDGVVSVNSLYYCNNPKKSIKEFSYVLKSGGKLVLMTPFIYPIHDAPDDKYRFTEYGIRELLKEDFIIENIKAIGGIFNLPAVLFHSMIKGIPLLAPKSVRKAIWVVSIIILYPFYIAAQAISVLDFLDKSKRWSTYYFTIAIKK